MFFGLLKRKSNYLNFKQCYLMAFASNFAPLICIRFDRICAKSMMLRGVFMIICTFISPLRYFFFIFHCVSIMRCFEDFKELVAIVNM